MFKYLLSLLLASSLFGLTDTQINKINDVYNIAKKYKANDGMTFENAIIGMIGAESSFGVMVVGDKYENGKLKSLYKSSLGNFQIKLSTAKLTIRKRKILRKKYGKHYLYSQKYGNIYPELNKLRQALKEKERFAYLPMNTFVEMRISSNNDFRKMTYYDAILHNKQWLKRAKEGNVKAIKTLKWAKNRLKYHQNKFNMAKDELIKKAKIEKINLLEEIEIIKNRLSTLEALAYKDTLLINKLLTDHKFSTEIAVNYLIMIYNEAVQRGFNNPYKRSIGRYNGGWNNTRYYNKVMKNKKIARKYLMQPNK